MAVPSFPDPIQALPKLKDLFLLLDPDDASLSEEDLDRREELRQKLEYYTQCSRRMSDYHHMHRPRRTQPNFSDIVPRFMQLLRESVLGHQWPQALKLVQTLSQEQRGTEAPVWKVGLACLYQDTERNGRLVEQFVKHLYALEKLAVVEVILDYLLFLLTQSNIEDAKALVQELKKNTMFPSQLVNDKRKMAHTLFFAYQGLILYAEWKLAIFKADQEENDTDMVSLMVSQGASVQAAKSIADSAVEYLVTIKDVHGVWDIFITRLVEIYEYYGQVEEASNILRSYRNKNPTNPNAHRYLFEFESRREEDRGIRIDCLKSIIKLDPCNPLCLTLFQLTEADEPEAVRLLFDYLDFCHSVDSHSEDIWQALATKLQAVNSDTRLKMVVTKCWEIRKAWWLQTVLSGQKTLIPSVKHNKKLVKEVLDTLGT